MKSILHILAISWPYIVTVIVIAAVVLGVIWLRRRPKPMNVEQFQEDWKELQKLCRDKAKWPEAIVEADKLLDVALRKRKFRGSTMGARMLKAQRLFSDSDSVWSAHKLRSKIDADPTTKLKEAEVKQALVGTRQALKDLGALPNGQQTNS
jgi:hypothetical protein